MAVLFQAFQSVLADKSGKKLFYPRVVRVATVNTAQLAKEVAAYSSLTAGDVKSAIDNLITVMTTHLQASESVALDGLGTFRMVMKSGGKGAETADEVSASQATLYVRFTPAKTRNADGTTATRSLVTGVKCVRFDKATVAEGAESNGDGGGSGNNGGNGEDPTA